jgi:hypothetical protein
MGVGINIAVSLGLALWTTDRPATAFIQAQASTSDWPRPADPTWPKPTQYTQATSFGVSLLSASVDGSESPPIRYMQVVSQYGFPMRSLEYDARFRGQGAPPWISGTAGAFPEWLTGPWLIPWIPARPVWLGFVVNSLLYSLLAYVSILGVIRMARSRIRARRVQRGACATCSHPLNGLALCPECGHGQDAQAA